MLRQHPLDLHATQIHIQHDLHHPEEQQQYQHRDHAGSNDHHGNRLDKVIQRIDQYADEHYTSRSGAITMLIVEATEEPKQKK